LAVVDPNDPKVGDDVVFGDALAIGDLCYFEDPKDGLVVIRKLHEWQVASFEGKIYRIEPGERVGVARIRLIAREDVLTESQGAQDDE
jgi:hypothetical protein